MQAGLQRMSEVIKGKIKGGRRSGRRGGGRDGRRLAGVDGDRRRGGGGWGGIIGRGGKGHGRRDGSAEEDFGRELVFGAFLE